MRFFRAEGAGRDGPRDVPLKLTALLAVLAAAGGPGAAARSPEVAFVVNVVVGVVDFDPLPYWRRVEAPTLVLYGAEDRNAPTARSVERLREAFGEAGPESAEIRVFDGLGHGLLAPMEGRRHRMALHPEVARVLSGWLRATVGGRGEVSAAPAAARVAAIPEGGHPLSIHGNDGGK